MSQTVSRLAIFALVLLIANVPAENASACLSVPPAPVLDGTPSDGATGVPTDVIPYYFVPDGVDGFDRTRRIPATFTLASSAGELIPVVPRPDGDELFFGAGFELIPAHALAPQTSYVLTARWTERGREVAVNELRFSTGAGPLLEPPAPPAVKMWHFRRPRPVSSCDPEEYGTCILVGPDVFVATLSMDEFGQGRFPGIQQGSYTVNLTGREQGTNFRCEQVRTRALNGTYSEPVEVCGSDFGALVEVAADAVACGEGAKVPASAAHASVAANGQTRAGDAATRTLAADAGSAWAAQPATSSQETPLARQPDEGSSPAAQGCSVSADNSQRSSAVSMLLALAALLTYRSARRRAAQRDVNTRL